MTAACTLAGCANDGSPNMFSADFWHRDPNAVAVNDQYIRNDKRPITQYNNGYVDETAAGYNRGAYSYNSSSRGTYDAATGTYRDARGNVVVRRDVNSPDYSVTGSPATEGPSRPAGVPNDATSGTVMNDTQLQHGTDKTRISAAINSQDQQFVLDAASGGLYEVQSSQKALVKSQDSRVKTIAQHMIDDHTKANNALMALAQRKGVAAASLMTNPRHTQMLQQLDAANGSDFDRLYLDQQRQAHTESIAAFQAEANNGFDRDIRDFAASTLPTLRGHLDMINNNNPSNLGNER
jgi:putative membrane protein